MNIFTKTQEIIKPVVSINERNNKVFNIHLNPNNIDLNANTNNDMTYQFNFDSLDKGKYKLTFSYVGIFQRYRSLRVMSLNEIYGGRPYIFCDLGQLSNTFMPDDSDRCNNSFLFNYTDKEFEPYRISNTRYNADDNNYIKDYSMILHFELLEEY